MMLAFQDDELVAGLEVFLKPKRRGVVYQLIRITVENDNRSGCMLDVLISLEWVFLNKRGQKWIQSFRKVKETANDQVNACKNAHKPKCYF